MKKAMTALVAVAAIVAAVVLAAVIFLHQKKFGRLPQGARLERIEKSPNWHGGEFRNLDSTVLMVPGSNRFSAMLRFIFSDKSGLRPDKPIGTIKTDLHKLQRDSNLLVWFGHSSYLLQINGKRFLVDPVFYLASPVSFINRAFKVTDIYKPKDMPDIDYLIITHDHWDHLDYRTITELKDKVGKVICPLGVGEDFEYWGYAPDKIAELDWNEHASFTDSLCISCIPARHFSGRGLKPNQTLWASFMIESAGTNIFIGGDSGYGSHFKAIGERFGKTDLAILENGQYNKQWSSIHTMPQHLAAEARELKAAQVLTVHHLKYALSRHRWDEPLQNEKKLAAEIAPVPVLRPKIGEICPFETHPQTAN